MSFMNAIKNELNNETKLTENGAVAYRTSGKKLLDLNFAVASLRGASEQIIINKFMDAYWEDPVTAIKWLFYTRDCREGLGERRLFRIVLKHLAQDKPEVIRAVFNFTPTYGRYDDVWCLLDTNLKKDVISVMAEQLTEDKTNMKNGKPISLLVKYCAEHLADKVDIIGSHNGYDRSSSYADKRAFYELPEAKLANPRDVAKSIGKEYFVDEFNVTLHSTYAAYRNLQTYEYPLRGVAFGALVNKIMNMGDIHNMYIWALYSQQWPNLRGGTGVNEFIDGVHIVGYLHNLRHTKIPTYPWYAIAMITRYLKKGDVFLGDDNGNTFVSALEREDGETTIVLTNYEDDETEIELDFAKSLEGKTFYKYVYDTHSITPDENMEMIKCSGKIESVNDKLKDKVLGLSVTVYTTEKP
jgi:hypothetical protein